MKTTSSSGTRKTPLKRSRAPASPRSESPPGQSSDPASCVRLELSFPTTLTVLEPVAPRGHMPLRLVRFGYFKPEARDVHLVGSFNGWHPQATPMIRDSLGDWSVELELPAGEHRYRFFVDGEWRDDPTAQQTAQNPFGGFDAIMVVV
jgi:hypothetical protein